MTGNEYTDIVKRHTSPNGRVLSILEEIQRKYRHLPEEALRAAAEELNLPLSQLYGVATFYTSFSLQPRGEHIIGVCHGTVCHVKGAARVTAELEKKLGVSEGGTTGDGKFTLESVKCLGCCSLAPVVSIDGSVHARVKPETVDELIKSAIPGGAPGD
ncbi:MAG: NADH-quinone oxidoreductase subunit NuoE [Peptococcaceae bacterium]|nr:NADH-quinone oxidoreductase subunit NuoE [Peptococcaceae bacterium]